VTGHGPELVLAAHGSPHAAHGPAVLALRDAVADARPGASVNVGWLGFDSPNVTDAAAAAALRAGRDAWVAVVPLLLTDGYHARHDIPAALASVRGAVQQPVLGPDPLLADSLGRRLREAGALPGDSVVLAAAGSSDPSARLQCEQAADLLAALLGVPVPTGYATGPGPSVTDAVERARGTRPHSRVVVATYLLGPGTLADRVQAQARSAGAVASAPLGTAPELVELVVRRWLAPALAPAA
jgi:sirohydrochlorin ferrochelatase